MIRKWIPVIAVSILVAGAAFLSADDKSVKKAVSARGVIFEKWGYKLKVTSFDSQCTVNLGKDPKRPSTYSLDLNASCKIPSDVDGVLITDKIKVLKALTDSGRSMLAPNKSRSSRSSKTYRSGTFIPILRLKKDLHVAQVEISKLALATNPYRLDKLETQLAVVSALERTEKTIPAIVSQTPTEVTSGLKTRLSSMKINSKRILTVEISCLRQYGGPKGAFIEAIKALDSDGKVIGESRITEGDPLGQKGKVTSFFLIAGSADPASLKLTIVTDSKVQKIPFEISGIFQK